MVSIKWTSIGNCLVIKTALTLESAIVHVKSFQLEHGLGSLSGRQWASHCHCQSSYADGWTRDMQNFLSSGGWTIVPIGPGRVSMDQITVRLPKLTGRGPRGETWFGSDKGVPWNIAVYRGRSGIVRGGFVSSVIEDSRILRNKRKGEEHEFTSTLHVLPGVGPKSEALQTRNWENLQISCSTFLSVMKISRQLWVLELEDGERLFYLVR